MFVIQSHSVYSSKHIPTRAALICACLNLAAIHTSNPFSVIPNCTCGPTWKKKPFLNMLKIGNNKKKRKGGAVSIFKIELYKKEKNLTLSCKTNEWQNWYQNIFPYRYFVPYFLPNL